MITKDSSSLILPRQNERILQAVIESRVRDKEKAHKLEVVNREKKIQDRKLGYAHNFVKLVARCFKVTQESVPQLLENFTNEDLLTIDEAIAKNLKPKAILQISGFSAWLLAVILSSIFVPGSGLWAMLFFPSSVGIMPAILLALSFTDSSKSNAFLLNNYLVSRKRLKSQYGSKYFPYQELSKILGSGGNMED